MLLSSGRSHRSGADVELVRWDRDFARASASVESAGRTEELEVVIQVAAPGRGTRKRIRVNGVNRRPAALAPMLRTVLFAPEDMELIVGSPSLRRNLLDDLVVQREVTAASVLATYARALTQRNSLLKRIREEVAGRHELGYWDDVVCERGGRLLDWRRETLAALAAPLAAAHGEIAPHEPVLSLRYASNAEARPGETPQHSAAPAPAGDRRQGGLERRHARGTTPRRRRLRSRRPRPDALRLHGASSARPSSPSSWPSSTCSPSSTDGRRSCSSTTSSASSTQSAARTSCGASGACRRRS